MNDLPGNTNQQRGSVLILFALMMVVLLSFAAFSIDVGYIYLMRMQLQNSADAAALAGAAKLPNSSAAITAAQQYANSNMSGQGTILASSDIVIGTWDAATRILTATTVNPTAIQVKASRTSAKGNPVNLFFAAIFGITTTDVTASATAQMIYPKPDYNLIGMTSVNVSGGSVVDSYDSSVGPYSSSVTQNGHIASNGNISVSNGANIKGDARPGIGKTTSVTGGSTVTGSKTPLTQAMSNPSPAAPTSYNNQGLGTSLNVSSGNITLTPGTYYFTNLTVSNGYKLTITGPTTIYISGTMNIGGGGMFNNTSNATNLNLYFTSTATTATISNGANFYGSIYGPSVNLSVSGGSAIYGSFIAKTFTLSNGVSVHLDKNVKLSFKNPTVQLVK